MSSSDKAHDFSAPNLIRRLSRTLSGRHLAHRQRKPDLGQSIPEGVTESPEKSAGVLGPSVTEQEVDVELTKSLVHVRPKPTGRSNGFKRLKDLAKPKGHKETHISKLSTEPVSQDDLHSPERGDHAADELDSLAWKIKELIDSLSHSGLAPSTFPTNHIKLARDADGRPILPPDAVPIKDDKLIAQLFDHKVMNGNDQGKPSVWSILERLGSSQHSSSSNGSGIRNGKDSGNLSSKDNSARSGGDTGDTKIQATLNDTNTIMLYAPLIPIEESQVELANSTTLASVTSPGSKVQLVTLTAGEQNGVLRVHSARKWWPFHGKNRASTTNAPHSGGATASNSSSPGPLDLNSSTAATDKSLIPAPAAQKKVWLPSTTKVSIQAFWWGYRIFLPPPVLATLNNDELEAEKRATMIADALTWFFNNLPIIFFPPPLQPVLLVLQKVVPYIRYIGTFISWSWSTIQGFDVGYGVILNATWVLPVALIPSTWEATSYPDGAPTPIKATTPETESTPGSTPSPTSATPTSETTPSVVTAPPSGNHLTNAIPGSLIQSPDPVLFAVPNSIGSAELIPVPAEGDATFGHNKPLADNPASLSDR